MRAASDACAARAVASCFVGQFGSGDGGVKLPGERRFALAAACSAVLRLRATRRRLCASAEPPRRRLALRRAASRRDRLRLRQIFLERELLQRRIVGHQRQVDRLDLQLATERFRHARRERLRPSRAAFRCRARTDTSAHPASNRTRAAGRLCRRPAGPARDRCARRAARRSPETGKYSTWLIGSNLWSWQRQQFIVTPRNALAVCSTVFSSHDVAIELVPVADQEAGRAQRVRIGRRELVAGQHLDRPCGRSLCRR